MKKLIVLTVIVSFATLAGFYGGKQVCMLMWPGSVNPNTAWYTELGLTEKQAAILRDKESSFRASTDKLCMKICAERLALLNQMKAASPDRPAVEKKIEEIGALQVAIEKEIASHILNVKENLTPAQSQVYLDRIHEQFRETMRQSGYGEILNQ